MTDPTAPDKVDMMLAFGFETARAIARADGRLELAELAKIEGRFPITELRERGLIGDDGPTARFGKAYNLALAKLKSLLSEQEKLELADAFFDICRADADVDACEVEAIVFAMRTLGVSKARLAEHMRHRVARTS